MLKFSEKTENALYFEVFTVVGCISFLVRVFGCIVDCMFSRCGLYFFFFYNRSHLGIQSKFVSLIICFTYYFSIISFTRHLYWSTYLKLIPPKFCVNLLIKVFNVTHNWYLVPFSLFFFTFKTCIFGENKIFFSYLHLFFFTYYLSHSMHIISLICCVPKTTQTRT